MTGFDVDTDLLLAGDRVSRHLRECGVPDVTTMVEVNARLPIPVIAHATVPFDQAAALLRHLPDGADITREDRYTLTGTTDGITITVMARVPADHMFVLAANVAHHLDPQLCGTPGTTIQQVTAAVTAQAYQGSFGEPVISDSPEAELLARLLMDVHPPRYTDVTGVGERDAAIDHAVGVLIGNLHLVEVARVVEKDHSPEARAVKASRPTPSEPGMTPSATS